MCANILFNVRWIFRIIFLVVSNEECDMLFEVKNVAINSGNLNSFNWKFVLLKFRCISTEYFCTLSFSNNKNQFSTRDDFCIWNIKITFEFYLLE